MFRGLHHNQSELLGFPRVRGDVPHPSSCLQVLRGFSPRARGCSGGGKPENLSQNVFPACAGMFLRAVGLVMLLISFPRVRGDVPPADVDVRRAPRFSPRARGCSLYRYPQRDLTPVFPACAGMFRLLTSW